MKKKRYILILFIVILSTAFVSAVYAADAKSFSRGSKGEDVYILQNRLRDLGYVSFRATGNYSDMTYNGVGMFQQNNELSKDGMVGDEVWNKLFKLDIKRVPINTEIPRVFGSGITRVSVDYGWLSKWSVIDSKFTVGSIIKLTDFNTGTTFNVIRTGGTNHADVEPASSEDKAGFIKCFKGYSWEKRAFIAEIEGTRYAASLFGMTNGNDTVEGNDIEGALCLYFNESKSEIGAAPDAEHNANISRAAGLS